MSTSNSGRPWLIGFLVFTIALSIGRLIRPLFPIPITSLGRLAASKFGIDEKALGLVYRDKPFFLTPFGATIYSIPTAVILSLIIVWIAKKLTVRGAQGQLTDADKER